MNSLWRFLRSLFREGDGASKPIPSSANATNVREEPESVSKEETPYGVATRPSPSGNDLNEILPSQVGGYVRPSLDPPDSFDESIYATYKSDTGKIFVELGICREPLHAQTALGRAKTETDAEFPDDPQTFVKSEDVLCLKSENRRGAFMAWTRGSYYFSAHASGGKSDLDAFMGTFPY